MSSNVNTQHYDTALQALVHVHNHPVHLQHHKHLVPQAMQQALQHSDVANITTINAQTLLLTDATTFNSNI